MNILAIDTATEACSVALYCSANTVSTLNESVDYSRVSNIFEIIPQQQSQQLLPMIDKLLSEAEFTLSNIDLLAYGRGPGSFTGVRIAASTIQGLALGADLPVAEVSTLAAMAQEEYVKNKSEACCVLIDARMQEVYQGQYSIINGIVSSIGEEKVHSPEQAKIDLNKFVENHQGKDIGLAGTGFASYAAIFSDYLQNIQSRVDYPNAKYMLPLAIAAYEQKKTVEASNIQPIYVRDTVTWKKLPHKQ